MKATEETWVCVPYSFHSDTQNPHHSIEQANCPQTDMHDRPCPVTTVAREMVKGCDEGADIIGRAYLMAAAPDLYRALQWFIDRVDASDVPGQEAIEAGRHALAKARGES